ncbi:NAD(P)-binding Rossmann-fold superfamily protein [Euphorbia peplus]|nr:NAD(P)-binding Rossmann-fold superfamily protein [Euphorbia peplus]
MEEEGKKKKKKVVVIGGTGYLGQHILQGLSGYDVAFTYHSHPHPHFFPNSSIAFHLDLLSGHGFHLISQQFGQPDVVVNCAAMSVPRACENDPHTAMSINVPSSLVQWMLTFKPTPPLLIHLSTDQVYQGLKSFYKEEDETLPVNVYGKSKVTAEQLISQTCPNYAILRSSIIFGPQTISPVAKSLPIQWIDSVLSQGEQVEFFHDEFRCPVYVNDVVAVILALIHRWISECKQMKLVLNVGGPDRLSRVQMAEVVADVRGYNRALIKPVSASTVDRGVLSPADISMDISKLIQTVNVLPTSFKDGVKLTLESA